MKNTNSSFQRGEVAVWKRKIQMEESDSVVITLIVDRT